MSRRIAILIGTSLLMGIVSSCGGEDSTRANPPAPTITTSNVSTTTQNATVPHSTAAEPTATTSTVASLPLPKSELVGVTGLITIRSIDTSKRVVHLELLCVEPDSKQMALGAYEVADGAAEFNSFSRPANPASGHVDRVSFDAWTALAAVQPVWVLRATKEKVAIYSVHTPSGPTVCRATIPTSDLPTMTASGIAGLTWGTDYDVAMSTLIGAFGPTTSVTEYRGRCRERRAAFGDLVVHFDYDYMLAEQQSDVQLARTPRLSMADWPADGLHSTGEPRLATDRGIALGSTLVEVQNVYPELLQGRLFGQQSRNDNLIVRVEAGVVVWIYAFSSHGVPCGD